MEKKGGWCCTWCTEKLLHKPQIPNLFMLYGIWSIVLHRVRANKENITLQRKKQLRNCITVRGSSLKVKWRKTSLNEKNIKFCSSFSHFQSKLSETGVSNAWSLKKDTLIQQQNCLIVTNIFLLKKKHDILSSPKKPVQRIHPDKQDKFIPSILEPSVSSAEQPNSPTGIFQGGEPNL